MQNILGIKLAGLRRTLRATMAVAGLAMPALAVAAWVAVSFVADRLLEPPLAVRAGLLVGGVLAVAWLAWWGVVSPLLRRFTDEDLAVIVERRWPGLENRLISTVQLLGADVDRLNYSRDMIGQTVADCHGQTAQMDFNEAVDRGKAWRGPASVVLAAALPAALAFTLVAETRLWAKRCLLLQEVRRPRETKLQLLEPSDALPSPEAAGTADATPAASPAAEDGEAPPVAYREVRRRRGDSVTVAAEVRPESAVVPDSLDLLGSGDPVGGSGSGSGAVSWLSGGRRTLTGLEAVKDRVFRGTVKNLQGDVTLYVRGGDDEIGPVRVRVVDPINCTGMRLECRYPGYMNLATETKKWGGPLRLPAGTVVTLTGTTDKDLSAAEVRIAREMRDAAAFEGPAPSRTADGSGVVYPLTVLQAAPAPGAPTTGAGRREFRAVFTVHKNVAMDFTLVDEDGLPNFTDTKPIRLEIEAVPDRPPVAELRLRGIGDMVTANARVPMRIVIRDDVGVQDAKLAAMRLPTPEETLRDRAAKATEIAARPLARRPSPYGPAVRKVELDDEAMELGELGLAPGQRIEFEVRGRDFKPQEGGTEERSRKPLEVVTPETLLLKLVERQLALRAELDAKIRTQQDLIGDLEKGIEADKADTVADETYQSVRRVALSQRRLYDDLRRIRDGFADIKAEMENNRVGSPSDMARLTEIVDTLAALVEERLKPLHDHLESVLGILPDAGTFFAGWDEDRNGRVDDREWSKSRLLLDRLDPSREFTDSDLAPGLPGLRALFESLDKSRFGSFDRAASDGGMATLKLRLLFLWTASSVQKDALERMRRVRRLLPRSEKFGAVISEVRRVIDRQKEASQSLRKAETKVGDDLFEPETPGVSPNPPPKKNN
jgi:hypothetical protein